MSDEIDLAGEFEWDDMIDRVVDLIPAKMTPRECRELRENVHNSLWASIGDLFNSAADAIGSVANYFVGHGWKPGLPTTFTVDMRAEGENLATLLAPDINPSFTSTQMAERGVRVLGADRYDRPLALIELKNGSSGPTQYIAGTENFYAVTRYNWSAFYALSVIELGREVHDAYLAGQSAARTGAPSAKATASAL